MAHRTPTVDPKRHARGAILSLPAGLFAIAAVLDLVHLAMPDARWSLAAYWVTVAGLLAGIAAAANVFSHARELPRGTYAAFIARLYGTCNTAVLVLFGASLWLRRGAGGGAPEAAIVCSMLGVALASVTAWLSGELAERLDDEARGTPRPLWLVRRSS